MRDTIAIILTFGALAVPIIIYIYLKIKPLMKNGDKRRGLESSQNTQRRGSAKPENDLIRHFL